MAGSAPALDRSLAAQLARYGSHHAHPLNRAIHFVVDPLGVGLALALLDLLRYPGGVGLGTCVYVCLAFALLHLHRVAGLLSCAIVGVVMWLASGMLGTTLGVAACAGVWLAITLLQQVVGHGVFERRAPAYLAAHAGLSPFERAWESLTAGLIYWPLHVLFFAGLYAELAARVRTAEERLREGA